MTARANGVRVILLGAPGAGKGTQARRISESFGVPHVATGDMFRAAVNAGTPMGTAAKKFMDRGELVPDDVAIGVVEERLSHADVGVGFVMDGFPRTAAQATAFDALLAKMGKRLDAAIELSVPRELLISRVSSRLECAKCQASYHIEPGENPPSACTRCGGDLVQRVDDAEATVLKRLAVYERQTAPLLAYYKGAGLLRTIDGTKDAAQVSAAIAAALSDGSGVRTAS